MQDVGTRRIPGSTSWDPVGHTCTVTGSGRDLRGTTDEFHFAARRLPSLRHRPKAGSETLEVKAFVCYTYGSPGI